MLIKKFKHSLIVYQYKKSGRLNFSRQRLRTAKTTEELMTRVSLIDHSRDWWKTSFRGVRNCPISAKYLVGSAPPAHGTNWRKSFSSLR